MIEFKILNMSNISCEVVHCDVELVTGNSVIVSVVQSSECRKKDKSSFNIIPFIEELNRFKLEKKAWSELIIIEHNTIRSSSQLVNAPDFYLHNLL